MNMLTPSAKILVAYHKPAPLLKSEVIVPIHCGRALVHETLQEGALSAKSVEWLLENMIGDDTGCHISYLNRQLSEMTMMYWAFKNYDKLDSPDYIGFMHYERHLSLPGYFAFDDHLGMDDYIKCLGLNNESIHALMRGCDAAHGSRFISQVAAPNRMHDQSFLVNVAEYLQKKNSPWYNHWVNAFDKEKKAYYQNCFIMKREMFFDFAEVFFDILLALCVHPNCSTWKTRIPAYMGEHLISVYFTYLKLDIKATIVKIPKIDHRAIYAEYFDWGQKQSQQQVGLSRPLQKDDYLPHWKTPKRHDNANRTVLNLYRVSHSIPRASSRALLQRLVQNSAQICEYWQYHKSRLPDGVVYCCLNSHYEDLLHPIPIHNDFDYVCFVDPKLLEEGKEARIGVWKLQPWPMCVWGGAYREVARRVKWLPFRLFPEYNLSVYIETPFALAKQVYDLKKYAAKSFCVTGYNSSGCAYKEIVKTGMDFFKNIYIKFSSRQYNSKNICRKVDLINLLRIIILFRTNRFPKNYGLLINKCIIRTHHNKRSISIMNMCLDLIEKYNIHDEYILPYVLWKYELKLSDMLIMQ